MHDLYRQELQVLLQSGKITQPQIDTARASVENDPSLTVLRALVRNSATEEKLVAAALAKVQHLDFVDPTAVVRMDEAPRKTLTSCVPASVAEEYQVFPVGLSNGRLKVAIADPKDLDTFETLRVVLCGASTTRPAGIEVRELLYAVATPTAIESAIARCYGGEDVDDDAPDSNAVVVVDNDAGEDDPNAGPAIKIVDTIIREAVAMGASDIHAEPIQDAITVRVRVDGMLRTMHGESEEADKPQVPEQLKKSVISRFKVMAKMDLAEKQAPQDKQIMLTVEGRRIDFRVSSLPTVHGERIVLRILDASRGLVPLPQLGFGEHDQGRFENIVNRPQGLILVTGPTGSGKTTTLYSVLQSLNTGTQKIVTIEQPIEYRIDGLFQSEVRPEIDLDFKALITANMRHAPNIILVGEIRDLETANAAIQAALTGHLVFSTLHTNDAPTALPRLTNINVPSYLVGDTVTAVLAQRLGRVLCRECKREYQPEAAELEAIHLTPEQLSGTTVYRAVGCQTCGNTGYKGRQGVFELMLMTPELRELARQGAAADEIQKQAELQGMRTLFEDACAKFVSGMFSIDEVLRITHGSEA